MTSIAYQNAQNYAVSQHDQMPWQVSQALAKARNGQNFDFPILAHTPRMDTDPAFLVDFCRRISDCQCLSRHPLYGDYNPNGPDLYRVMQGKIKSSDYSALMRLFGDESAVPLKDNHFFHGAEKTLTSQIITQPFSFTTKNISTDFAQKSILEDSKKGAKLAVQALVAGMMAQGDGSVSPLQDPSVKLPKTPEDWLAYATGQEQVEGTIWKLLQHINLTHNFQNLARTAIKHKFRVNAEFAFVDVANGDVVPRCLHPESVRWMAGRPVETLEDPAVFAVQLNEYMTPTELVNTFGVGRLATGTGIKGVFRYVEKLFEKNPVTLGYDPAQSYWSSRGISADTGYYCFDDREKEYTSTQVNWMRNTFYPMRGGGKLLVNILVQRNFFLMQKEKRFMVERVERNGTRSGATDKELKAWQTARHTINYDIDFTPVSATTPARSNIKTYMRPELWQFTRIGHDGFIDIGPYPYQPDFDEDTQQRSKVNWPIVGQISYDKSMALLGENDAQRANILMQKVDMFLADLGYEEALIIDDIHGKEPISYRYNAKQTGLLRITSTNYNNGNPAGGMHLKTVKLSNGTEQMRLLFGMVREFTIGYEVRVGAGPDVQGQTSEYASGKQQQLNIANQTKLNVEFNLEHSMFMNQLLQRCADVSKFHYAQDKQVLILLSKNEWQVLQLTYKLRTADFAVYLESGQVLADKKKMLDQLVGQLMQSGGIDQADALMQIILSDNPAKGYADYRQALAAMREQQALAAQSQQEQARAMLADKQADRDHEIQLAKITADTAIRTTAMKLSSDRAKEEFEGLMSDISTNTNREDKVIDAQIQSQQATEQAALDAQASQSQPANQ